MGISNEELLRKAVLDTAAFGGAGEAPLTVEQVEEFLRVAIKPQAMLPVVRTVFSNAQTWQESKLIFGSRVMRPGTEGVRNVSGDRVAPTTGNIEIQTSLIRGEVPVTDEVFEDQVERAGFADTLRAMIAEQVGLDVEEVMVNGDTGSGDTYLALFNGWFEVADDASDNVQIDVSGDGQDYQLIFNKLVVNLPDEFKRDVPNTKMFAPLRLIEKYRDILASRGTALGDFALEGERKVVYQGYEVIGVPILTITAGSPDTAEILFTHRLNCYAGFQRMLKFEQFRDPREGNVSFVITARVNAQIAHTPATVLAQLVDVEP